MGLKPLSFRKYIQHCIDGKIIYSIHQREDYCWDEEQCLDYLNNLLHERVSHIIAFCQNYSGETLRGHQFSTDTKKEIDINKQNLNEAQPFDKKKVFSFDGRHKSQLLIWVVEGCKVKFPKKDNAVRFYLQFKLDINDNGHINTDLSYSSRAIVTREVPREETSEIKWFCSGENNKELNILFKNIDKLLYPRLNSDLMGRLKTQIKDNKIKIPNVPTDTLATFLFSALTNLFNFCLIYSNNESYVSNIISFQERDVTGLTDAEISRGIRDSQKGETWSALEVFKNHGENILGFTGFKKLLKDQTQKIIKSGFVKQSNDKFFQRDVVIQSYTIRNKSGLTEGVMEKECDQSSSKIYNVIHDFKDITYFTSKIYKKLSNILPNSLIEKSYMRIFSIVFSMMYHAPNKDVIKEVGDWHINDNTKYYLKLLMKLSFKFYPQTGDKGAASKNIEKVINTFISSNPPPYNEDQYNETENKINEYCRGHVENFDFKTINQQDINSDLFYHIVYGRKPNGADLDHSLSKNESKKYYEEYPNSREMAVYEAYYMDSIYNIKYLHSHENRSPIVKGKKTQKEFYIDEGRQALAEDQHIDIQAIADNLSPYQRMRKNKIKLDPVIKQKFSVYGFREDEFKLDLPRACDDGTPDIIC